MNFELYALIIPFCAIPVLLVSLDYFKKISELDKRNRKVIDFDKFLKNKQKGDVVDIEIAKLLDIKNIAA
tara:strand:- start:877 stop:1086 length:210 start_codon:yes stop_codon:yes gene_type:complete